VVFSLTVSVRGADIAPAMLDAVAGFLRVLGRATAGRPYIGPIRTGFQVRSPFL